MVTAALPDDKASTRERRWPVGVALLTAWLLPATTVRRTRHASLMQVWLVHFVSVLLTAITVFFFVGWSDAGGWVVGNVFVDALERVLRGISREFDRRPGDCVLWVVGVALAIEFAVLFAVAVAMPWGACDEGRWASYRSALRRVWLRTSHVLVIVFVLGSAIVIFERMERIAITTTPRARILPPLTPPNLPTLSPDDPGYQRAMDDFDAATHKYDQSVAERARLVASWRRNTPWYLEHWEPLMVVVGFCMVLWFSWGLLRSVGAPRDVIPIARPPTCEDCGYNLTSIAMESRCPECGEAVLKSLGPGVRAGTPWQRRETIGRIAAWRQCAVLAVVNPRELGRQLRTADPGTDHRRFFALHLPVVFLVGFTSMFAFAWLSAPRESLLRDLPIFLTVTADFGFLCVGGMVVFTLLGPLLTGPVERMRALRNLLPAAMQIACYLSTYLTLWAVFGGATGLGVYLADEAGVFRSLQNSTGVFHETLLMLAWLAPNSVWGIWFFVLVHRGALAAAYANR